MCNHAGSMDAGHYTAFVRGTAGSARERWFLADDRLVAPVPSEAVVTPGAYVLWYRRTQPPLTEEDPGGL